MPTVGAKPDPMTGPASIQFRQLTASSAARWPSRSAAAAAVRSPATRTPAALRARRPEIAARYRQAASGRIGCAPNHDPAGFVEFGQVQPRRPFRRRGEKQMGPRGAQRDQCRKLGIAAHRAERLVGPTLKAFIEKVRDRGRGQRRRHRAASGPGQKERRCDDRKRGRDDAAAQTERRTRWRRK